MTSLTRISGYAHVAERYGFEEAVFLDAIMFWYRTNRGDNRNFYDGRWWTYNSVKAYEGIFPWWHAGQIRRIITRCREKGALLAGDYNEDRRDRTAWYSPSDELLALYGESETCICRKQQMQTPDPSSSVDENGKCNIRKPCSNHVETDLDTPYSPPDSPADCRPRRSASPNDGPGDAPPAASGPVDKPAPVPKPKRTRREKSAPDHDPEAFGTFWSAYPRKDNRKKSIEAWDKLKPDRELCRVMYTALKRQCRDPKWAEEGGRYIPMFSTWLNQRRWENQGVDLSLIQVAPPQNPGGWADAPEVYP